MEFFVMSIFTWLFVNALHLYRVMKETRNIDRDAMIVYIIIGYGKPHFSVLYVHFSVLYVVCDAM